MNEIWKPFTEGYSVSNYGNVVSHKRQVLYHEWIIDDNYKCPLKGWVNNGGYCMIDINRKNINVHKLVATCFMDNYNGENLDHIDGDKLNNHISNLRICNQHQNTLNSKIRNDNQSGFKGIHFDKSKNMWVSCINIETKQYRKAFQYLYDAIIDRENKVKENYDKEYYIHNR
jgi:hypothetical protein